MKRIIFLIMLIALIFVFLYCGKSKILNTRKKYVDIYNVVKEAFITDKGYSYELSKHMSEEVFKRTNIYNAYPVNSPEYKKPFKVDFNLNEKSQAKKGNIIYVKMNYSVIITDAQNKCIGGSKDVSVTFTVKITGNEWYIVDKYEPA